jgi:hypothetical protein
VLLDALAIPQRYENSKPLGIHYVLDDAQSLATFKRSFFSPPRYRLISRYFVTH